MSKNVKSLCEKIEDILESIRPICGEDELLKKDRNRTCKSVVDIFRLDLACYCATLADANQKMTVGERIFLRDSEIDITRNFIDNDRLSPVVDTLAACVTAENVLMASGECPRIAYVDSICATVFRSLVEIGSSLLASDEDITETEVRFFSDIISDMQKYLYENLKKTDFRSVFRVNIALTDDNDEVHSNIIVDGGQQKSADILSAENDKELDGYLDELNSLIGLDGVKNDVSSLINLLKIQQLRKRRGLKQIPISLHMVFTGNPGTGKTTVARLLAKIYRKIGVLSSGHLVEVDRSGLVAGFVGQTALKVQEVLAEAKGGILFIDEAYSLCREGAGSDYGKEAIDILVKSMEDNRDDLVIVAAGYPAPMEKFLDANPGLRSRFSKHLYFPDYRPEELMQIFEKFCKDSGYETDSECAGMVMSKFTEMYNRRARGFGNGREVRNFFEKAITNQANRLVSVSDPDNKALATLCAEDIIEL